VTRIQWRWNRPKQYGWPVLQMTDLKQVDAGPRSEGYAARKGTPMIARQIEVITTRVDGGEPELSKIRAHGNWASRPRGERFWRELRVRVTPDEQYALTFYAPDWVMELAKRAMRLAAMPPGASQAAALAQSMQDTAAELRSEHPNGATSEIVADVLESAAGQVDRELVRGEVAW
jgi:hypothetical protein